MNFCLGYDEARTAGMNCLPMGAKLTRDGPTSQPRIKDN